MAQLESLDRGRLVPLGRSSDERLARRATKGDEQALGEIFERYQQELYRFCLGLLGEPQDAQDALQNTMVKALRALPGEKREIALRPWLYRIAHNEAVDLGRTRREAKALDWHLLDEQSSVADRAEQRERLEWLFRDLGDLPPRQRAVLVMRELSGLDFADIGAALGTSGAVVRQALYEARRNLEQMDLGRGLRCEAVTRVLSDADGRISSRRKIRAHLRDCPDCRRFQDRIEARKATFAGIAPLPIGVAAGLKSVLAGAGGSGAGGITAALGGGAAGSAGTAGVLKALATVAVAVVGTAAVEHGPHDQHGAAGDAAVASLSKQGHGAHAGSSRTKPRSSRGLQHSAHSISAAPASVAEGASPAAVVRGRLSAPTARDHVVAHAPSPAPEGESSTPAPPASGESPAPAKAMPESPEVSLGSERQEERTIEAEAGDKSERTQPAEPSAAPEEAPQETESAPAAEAEEPPESALHSPKGKAKGHEKQLSN